MDIPSRSTCGLPGISTLPIRLFFAVGMMLPESSPLTAPLLSLIPVHFLVVSIRFAPYGHQEYSLPRQTRTHHGIQKFICRAYSYHRDLPRAPSASPRQAQEKLITGCLAIITL